MTHPYVLHPSGSNRTVPIIDPRMSLSPHFNLREFTRSQTADKYDLYNVPRDEAEVANLRALAVNVLEPVRALFDRYVIITSGYRCATLNRLIGGAVTSQHLLGEAADIIVRGVPVCDAALAIASSDVAFDQMIYEARLRTGGWQEWIHISHKRLGPNRREVLTCVQDAGGGKEGESGGKSRGKRTLAGIHPVVDETLDDNANTSGGGHAA